MRSRALSGLATIAAMFTLAACAAFARGGAGPTYPLIVNNHTDFEVVVYAMPSVTGAGMRLGNARSFSTTTMAIPRNALQSADRLVLKLHSIGSNVAPWISPTTTIDSGAVTYVELRAA